MQCRGIVRFDNDYVWADEEESSGRIHPRGFKLFDSGVSAGRTPGNEPGKPCK